MFAGAVRALSRCGCSRPLLRTSGAAPPRLPLHGRSCSSPYRPFSARPPSRRPPPTPSSSSFKDDYLSFSWSFGMKNEWPPLKKCIQFQSYLLDPYLHRYYVEDDEGDETHYEYRWHRYCVFCDEDESCDKSSDIAKSCDESSEKSKSKSCDESSDIAKSCDESSEKSKSKSCDESSEKSSYDPYDYYDSPDYDDSSDSSSSDEDEAKDDSCDKVNVRFRRRKVFVGYKSSTVRKFLKQVRESRGYGIDVEEGVPHILRNPFDRCYDYRTRRIRKKWVKHGIKLAIKYINSKTGKVYEHVDTLAVVVALRCHSILLTFTAKVMADKEADAETFLAMVSILGPDSRNYELLECLLKPEGPAPWAYLDQLTDEIFLKSSDEA